MKIFPFQKIILQRQGKTWGDIRSKVNPIMMKSQTIRENLPQIDVIAQEFTKRFLPTILFFILYKLYKNIHVSSYKSQIGINARHQRQSH